MREQEPDSPLNDLVDVEGYSIAIDIQSIDFLVWHTTDGKKVTCSFYPSAIIMN